MPFDYLTVSLILGPLAILIVGSQNRADARAATNWTLGRMALSQG